MRRRRGELDPRCTFAIAFVGLAAQLDDSGRALAAIRAASSQCAPQLASLMSSCGFVGLALSLHDMCQPHECAAALDVVPAPEEQPQ